MAVVSMEARRLAVADALRRVADAERMADATIVSSYLITLDERLARLGADVRRVLSRLDALEGALESALVAGEEDDEPAGTTPPVPPLAMPPSGGMSPRASRALFGD